MPPQLLTSQSEFDELCLRMRACGEVAFDTEFVSEHTFRPQLCLLQFGTKEEMVAVDPLEGLDLTPWWEIMADEETRIIVHGGREEILFCWNGIGKAPGNLVDVQIVQGLLSRGFPLSHSAIVQKVMRKRIHGKETRTDWAKRPLTAKQIEYAVEDVRYLIDIAAKQRRRLKSTKRTEWADQECQEFVDSLVDAQRTRADAWVKLPKLGRLSQLELGIARDLFRWREGVADKTNRPFRTILRDDLLVDLAHRHPKTEAEVLSSRDMQRGNYKRHAAEIIRVIQEASQTPEHELPEKLKSDSVDHSKQEEHVLGKLLAIALANCCAEADLSPAIVASANDLRDFVRWYLGDQGPEVPKLAHGWRYNLCGEMLENLLDGKISLRVSDPNSDHPLVFESLPDDSKQ
ncbi:HRDC domain-containing protein [Rubinisphaera sp.]|uniref:ribonuclease D n=1 Tax=Rubinisphaera sp. TaxID=2024857 RepID=UPI000C0F2220|nr:HRDC domain-containing protein [Rubinisphaera sp.]MBV11289.1 ribonuclease D [Rubinisphaera sp.]